MADLRMQSVGHDQRAGQGAETGLDLGQQWREGGDLTGKHREWAGGSIGAEPRLITDIDTVGWSEG